MRIRVFDIMLFTLLIVIQITSLAQDFHFSMNQLSPLNLNPAIVGNFDGDLRINSNHRSQWSAVTIPYSTYSISADLNTKKQLPIGFVINQDRAGDSKFNTIQFNLGSAFNLISDSIQQLRVGFQSGITTRGINTNDITFDAQYNGTQFDPNLPTNENFSNFNHVYGNLNLGVHYMVNFKSQLIQIHASCFNLNQSNQSFLGATPPVSLDLKWIGKISHSYFINDFFSLTSSGFITRQGPHQEILIGTEFQYTLAELSYLKRAFWTGIYYRTRDAILISSGLIFDAWKIGLSYDINLSKLIPASNMRGGFEIGVAYIIKKKIKLVSPLFICPDYL